MAAWSGIGMNYGHQINASSYNSAQVDSDFNYFKANSINKIRIVFPGFEDMKGIAACQDMVKRAHAKGFYVVWGFSTGAGSGALTATAWAAYKSSVLGTLVSWAQNNHLSELCVGNECDLQVDGTTLTASTVRSDIRSLAGTIKSRGFAGKVSYSTAPITECMTPWITEGIGPLDCIGWNSYDNMPNFNNRNLTLASAFGNKAYISEFGCITNGYSDFNDENLYYIDTIGRIFLMKNAAIPSGYFFCYRDGGSFGLDANTFGLIETNGKVHLAREALIGTFV